MAGYSGTNGSGSTGRLINQINNLDEKNTSGLAGAAAGGSFGTAIEGYTGEQIYKVYGDVRAYITEPETTNDDVTFELVFLDVFERMAENHFSGYRFGMGQTNPVRLVCRVDRTSKPEYGNFSHPIPIV